MPGIIWFEVERGCRVGEPSRIRPRWPRWLTSVFPASVSLLVIGYEVVFQVALNPARSTNLFWFEVIIFGLIGPTALWLLLRQLARNATTTEIAQAQITSLRAQESYLDSVIASSADAIIGLDPEGRIMTWNQGAETLFGYRADEIFGQMPTALFEPGEAGQAAWAAVQGQVAAMGLVLNREMTARTCNGREVPVEVTYTQAHDAEGRLLGGAAIMRDISQRKVLAEEEQRRARELAALYAVSAAMNQAFSVEEALDTALTRVLEVLDLDSGRIYLLDDESGELALVTAQGSAQLLDLEETTITPGECLCGLAVQGGVSLRSVDPARDSRIVREGCRRSAMHGCVAAPLLGKDRMLGVLHVTARREGAFGQSDMALLRSVGAQIGVAVENMRLREEARRADALSTLIQEMHHRIKNNLQTVADLLSLEMSSSPNPEARKSLRDSITRIKSIAAVHQLLSLEQLRLTNITALARQVCDISLHHMVRPDRRIEATITGPAIYLPSKQATALALVMNELIANALEHAFDNGQRGHLAITLEQDGAQVAVAVADNGRGLPEGFDIDSRGGLGLQIVRTLVEKDLAGVFRLETPAAGGSRATLTFFK